MPSRRSVLGALWLGIASSAAGCHTLPGDGPGTPAGRTPREPTGTAVPSVPTGWTTRRAMPRAQGDVGSAVLGGKLHVAGGHFKHYGADGFHEALPYVEAFRPE